jgi:molecular chaperone HtpG
MSEVELRTTQVDLSGLMLVLGQHLYSTPAVAVRELVQNAHDSIVRRRLENGGGPERITLSVEGGDLLVTDTGAGLTRDEIVRYLATVGSGYTRELRGSTASEELIGYFGLGFLSAFVVADEVRVHTTSASTPDEAWVYRSRGGERYTLEPADPRPIGTEVRLRIKARFADLLSAEALGALLGRYAALLPIPVFFEAEAVNAEPPPWRDDGTVGIQALRARLAFAARFEHRFEPICTFDVAPDGSSDVRGLLWVQDGASWATSDNRNLSVFVRGMLLDDDARDLLPAWAGFIGGVVESARLTPVASREDLQRDEAWHATEARLRDVLVDALAALPRRSPEAWRRVRARHGEALLGAALADGRLFAALGDELQVPTSEGDRAASSLRRDGRLYVSGARHGGFEEMLFRALKLPIADGSRYGVLPFLRRWAERHGGTVVELGTEAGNRQLFRDVEPSASVRVCLERCLGGEDRRLVCAAFQPPELPLVLVPDREAELKRRIEDDQADKRISSAALGLARLFTASITRSTPLTLYVNMENPAIQALIAADVDRDHPAARLLRALAALVTGGGEDRPALDLGPTLDDFGGVVRRLLEA